MSILKPIIKKDTNKHLLILVHGLNGSDETWCGNEQRFVENLIREKLFIENFDLSLFLYDTSISPLNKTRKITN
ncbi:MAG TPA: hypothetical protein DCO90_02160, partial [Sphingobacterium sp.]|nr:hypothetical protein [Sphingobacterium sp.]